MIGLAIHTSSPELGLALAEISSGQMAVKSQVWPLGRDLTAYLHPCLQTFLAAYDWQSVGFLAVAKGPGGFTGTRIGVVVARTLAQQLQVPLFGISSLAAIAYYHYTTTQEAALLHRSVAVTLPAQRSEVFGAMYSWQDGYLHSQWPEAVYSAGDWQAKLDAYSSALTILPVTGGLAHTVTAVLNLAQTQWVAGDRPTWETVLPFYGQHPVPSLPGSPVPEDEGIALPKGSHQ